MFITNIEKPNEIASEALFLNYLDQTRKGSKIGRPVKLYEILVSL